MNNFVRMLLLRVDPACHLIKILWIHISRQFINLNHCLANSCASFTNFSDQLWIIKNTTRDLTMTTTQTKNKMERGLLLDVCGRRSVCSGKGREGEGDGEGEVVRG